MDDLIEDFGIGSYVHRQLDKAKKAASASGRDVELFSNTIYEFRLDKDELHVQDLDVLYLGENIAPIPMGGAPMIVKHIRKESTDTRGVLYKLQTPVDQHNVLAGATRFGQSLVYFDTRDTDQAVKLQIHSGSHMQPGAAYALYVTYTVKIASPEPRLFYVGSVQPQDFRDIRAQMGVTKATKRTELQLWSQKNTFEATFFDGTDPDLRPAATKVAKKDGIYFLSRQFSFDFSPSWDRSRYFGVFANWQKPS